MHLLRIASICAVTALVPLTAVAQQNVPPVAVDSAPVPPDATPSEPQTPVAPPQSPPPSPLPGTSLPASALSSIALEVGPGKLIADGTKKLGEGEYEIAIKDFDEAIELEARDASLRGRVHDRASAYFKRGEAWSCKGRSDDDDDCYERALNDYSAALLLDSASVDAYVHRGDAYRRLKRLWLAIDDYNEAIRRDANCAAAWVGRDNARLCLKTLQSAAQEQQECHKRRKRCANAHSSAAAK